MKIVTWNCNRGPAETKLAALEELDFDIAILQEIPASAPERVLWCGGTDKIGIGIVTKPPFRAELLPPLSDEGLYAFPVKIYGPTEFNLLAVWSMKNPTYVGALLKAFDIYRDFIGGGLSVVAGDFNSNSIWDKKHSSNNHSHLVSTLAASGLSSAYHSFYNVPHGEETHPTLYWRRRQADPFHIDYCFIPDMWLQNIVQVTVGDFAAWHKYSDHRPLLVELGDMTHE